MPTVTITNPNPLTLTLALTAQEMKAVVAAAAEINSLFPSRPLTTASALMQDRLLGTIAAVTSRYQERVADQLLAKFHDATPTQQAAAFVAVGGTMPE